MQDLKILEAKERLWQFSSDSFQAGMHSPEYISFYWRFSKLKNI
jgi:hypothetical protein